MKSAWLGTLAGLMAISCTQSIQAQEGPRLLPRDSVVLAESETRFVGRISGFAIAPSGLMYISDAANAVIHEYSAAGRPLRTFGRRGNGPGEFPNPGELAIVGDTVLLGYGGSRVQAFDLRSGLFRWQRRLPERPDALFTVAGRIAGSGLMPLNRASIRTFAGSDDPLQHSGPFPSPYGRNRIVDQTFGHAKAAAYSRDSVIVGFHASDFLFFGRLGDRRFDSVRVARRLRNGARTEVISTLREDPAIVAPYAYELSAPWSVGKLSSGRIGYVAVDQQLLAGRLAGKLYVSVVDPRTRKTCADTQIPVGSDPVAYTLFRGDTLLVLQQEESMDQQPRTVLRKFALDVGGCKWSN